MWDGGTNKQQWKKVVLSTCSASGFATRKMLGRHNINDIFLRRWELKDVKYDISKC